MDVNRCEERNDCGERCTLAEGHGGRHLSSRDVTWCRETRGVTGVREKTVQPPVYFDVKTLPLPVKCLSPCVSAVLDTQKVLLEKERREFEKRLVEFMGEIEKVMVEKEEVTGVVSYDSGEDLERAANEALDDFGNVCNEGAPLPLDDESWWDCCVCGKPIDFIVSATLGLNLCSTECLQNMLDRDGLTVHFGEEGSPGYSCLKVLPGNAKVCKTEESISIDLKVGEWEGAMSVGNVGVEINWASSLGNLKEGKCGVRVEAGVDSAGAVLPDDDVKPDFVAGGGS